MSTLEDEFDLQVLDVNGDPEAAPEELSFPEVYSTYKATESTCFIIFGKSEKDYELHFHRAQDLPEDSNKLPCRMRRLSRLQDFWIPCLRRLTPDARGVRTIYVHFTPRARMSGSENDKTHEVLNPPRANQSDEPRVEHFPSRSTPLAVSSGGRNATTAAIILEAGESCPLIPHASPIDSGLHEKVNDLNCNAGQKARLPLDPQATILQAGGCSSKTGVGQQAPTLDFLQSPSCTPGPSIAQHVSVETNASEVDDVITLPESRSDGDERSEREFSVDESSEDEYPDQESNNERHTESEISVRRLSQRLTRPSQIGVESAIGDEHHRIKLTIHFLGATQGADEGMRNSILLDKASLSMTNEELCKLVLARVNQELDRNKNLKMFGQNISVCIYVGPPDVEKEDDFELLKEPVSARGFRTLADFATWFRSADHLWIAAYIEVNYPAPRSNERFESLTQARESGLFPLKRRRSGKADKETTSNKKARKRPALPETARVTVGELKRSMYPDGRKNAVYMTVDKKNVLRFFIYFTDYNGAPLPRLSDNGTGQNSRRVDTIHFRGQFSHWNQAVNPFEKARRHCISIGILKGTSSKKNRRVVCTSISPVLSTSATQCHSLISSPSHDGFIEHVCTFYSRSSAVPLPQSLQTDDSITPSTPPVTPSRDIHTHGSKTKIILSTPPEDPLPGIQYVDQPSESHPLLDNSSPALETNTPVLPPQDIPQPALRHDSVTIRMVVKVNTRWQNQEIGHIHVSCCKDATILQAILQIKEEVLKLLQSMDKDEPLRPRRPFGIQPILLKRFNGAKYWVTLKENLPGTMRDFVSKGSDQTCALSGCVKLHGESLRYFRVA